MAVTQYIGARYIPLFYEASDHSNTWEAGVVYEPLVIVTYLNQSYTSKIPVPASVGNPADNPDYWAMTGAYNAQVAQLSQDVDDLRTDVQGLAGVMLYPERHVIIICDSYGTYNGAGAGFEVSYNILDRVLSYTGWNNDYIHYSAQNGAGFCNQGFINQLNALSIDEADLVEDIYVLGGWNDENGRAGVDSATFATQAAAFKTAALAAYPNAKLHICFAAWTFDTGRTNQDIRTTQGWYNALSKSGWIIEYNYAYILHNSAWLYGGNVHPNQNGVDALGDALGQILMNGECHAKFSTVSTTRTDEIGTLPGSSSIRIEQVMNDGNVYMDMRAVRGCYTLTTPQNIVCDGNSTAIDLFTYTGSFILKGYGTNLITGVTVAVYDGTNRYIVPAALYIHNQTVKLCFGYLPEGSTYKTIANATKVSVPDVGFTCKAW